MRTVPLPPDVNPIAVNKYININITVHRHVLFASVTIIIIIIIIIIRVPENNTKIFFVYCFSFMTP
jgi:hypothetical protein